uniref:(northern house mosquito) hypothetical protein n=1 Tax=Culex pipiens TaxID=7175 RepID=A0A8D8FDV8_CULPI
MRNLDAGRSAGILRDDPGSDHRDGRARGDGFAGSAVLRRGHYSDGMVLRKVQDGGGRGYGAGCYQCFETIVRASGQLPKRVHLFVEVVRRCIALSHTNRYEWIPRVGYGVE